jgi:hypothetical protein
MGNNCSKLDVIETHNENNENFSNEKDSAKDNLSKASKDLPTNLKKSDDELEKKNETPAVSEIKPDSSPSNSDFHSILSDEIHQPIIRKISGIESITKIDAKKESEDQNEITILKKCQFDIDLLDFYSDLRNKPFLNQSIDQIRHRLRIRKDKFSDELFSPSIDILIKEKNIFATALCNELSLNNFDSKELEKKLKWERINVIYENSVSDHKAEFIVDKRGEKLTDNSLNWEKYLASFSIDDLFRGVLEDTNLFCALMGVIIKNKFLLANLIPIDNALRQNVNLGAFRFRLWTNCDWYDVCVDDFLLVNSMHNILLAKNVTYSNEFWPGLFEKAVAK